MGLAHDIESCAFTREGHIIQESPSIEELAAFGPTIHGKVVCSYVCLFSSICKKCLSDVAFCQSHQLVGSLVITY